MFLPTLPAKTFLLVLLVCLNTACPSSKPSQEEVESQKQEQQNLPGEGGGITDQDKAAAAKLEQERVAKELAYKAAQEQGQRQDVPLSDEGNQSDSWSETGGGAGGNQPLLSDGEEEDEEKDQRKQMSGQQNPPGGGGAVTEEQTAEKELAAQELANKEKDELSVFYQFLNKDEKSSQWLSKNSIESDSLDQILNKISSDNCSQDELMNFLILFNSFREKIDSKNDSLRNLMSFVCQLFLDEEEKKANQEQAYIKDRISETITNIKKSSFIKIILDDQIIEKIKILINTLRVDFENNLRIDNSETLAKTEGGLTVSAKLNLYESKSLTMTVAITGSNKDSVSFLIDVSRIAFNLVSDKNQLDRMKKENEAAIKIQVEEVVAEEKKNNDVEPKTDPSEILESESMYFNSLKGLTLDEPEAEPEAQSESKKRKKKKKKPLQPRTALLRYKLKN